MPDTAKPEDIPQNLPLINAPDMFINAAQVLWAGNDPILVLNKIMPAAPTPGATQAWPLLRLSP